VVTVSKEHETMKRNVWVPVERPDRPSLGSSAVLVLLVAATISLPAALWAGALAVQQLASLT
jgi:hypothetical protein